MPEITVPPGQTAEVGICLRPINGIGAPGTSVPFSVTVTGTGTSATDTETFVTPDVHGVTLTPDPAFASASPGSSVPVELTITVAGNVAENVTLSAAPPTGVTLNGLPSTVALAQGETKTFPLTLNVSSSAALNTTLTTTITATLAGASSENKPSTTIQLSIRSAAVVSVEQAAVKAANANHSQLAGVLSQLSDTLGQWQANPTDARLCERAQLQLDNVKAMLAATPSLARFAPQIDALLAQTANCNVAGLLPLLTSLFADISAVFEFTQALTLSLAPARVTLEPGQGQSFNVRLENQGNQTLDVSLALGSVPSGVTASLNQTQVSLAPNTARTIPLTLSQTPTSTQVFALAVTATSGVVSQSAFAHVAVRPAVANVVSVTATPNVIDSGQPTTVTARILNAVNTTRAVLARLEVLDNSGGLISSSPDVPVNLTPSTDTSTVNLGQLSTTTLTDGLYNLRVSLLTTDHQPLPGRSAQTPFFVGSPVSASVLANPVLVPPGTSTVTTNIEVTNRTAIGGGDGLLSGNLTQLLSAVANASSSFSGRPPERAIDGNLNTSWFTDVGDAANLGTSPFLEILIPVAATITQLRMFGNREFADGFDFFAGTFQLFAANGSVLFDSGIVSLPAPDRDVTLAIPSVAGVRRVRFTATADEGNDPGFAELEVFGSVALDDLKTLPIGPIKLTALSTTFNAPIGIDHHNPSNKVVMSVNYSSGQPYNFELVAGDGSRTQFSNISDLTDEVKIATARDDGGGKSLGGFVAGELFVGTGVPGQIARIAADGTSVQNPWVMLPGEDGLLRGSLHVDRTGVFNGDLIVVTTAGGVWRVDSSGTPTRLASLNTHLEGLTTIPNDPGRYGPWEGKILIGAENEGGIYTVDPSGNTAFFELGIDPEDIEVIPANANFFGVDFGSGMLQGASYVQFLNMVGDILIAEENGILSHVRWTGSQFQATEIAQVSQWEHVTFSSAGVVEVPAAPRMTLDIRHALPTQGYVIDPASVEPASATVSASEVRWELSHVGAQPANFQLKGQVSNMAPGKTRQISLGTKVTAQITLPRAQDRFADVVLDYFDSGAGPLKGPYGGTVGGGPGWPAPVSVNVVLGGEPGPTGFPDFLSLPTGSYVTVGFTDKVALDGPGDDISIDTGGGVGEIADVYVSANGIDFTLLGTAFQNNGPAGFDLASIGFTAPVVAVKIVGRDNGGHSPGFDVSSLEIRPGSVSFPPIEVQLDLPPLTVVAAHIIDLDPTSRTVARGAQATYDVLLKNPFSTNQTFNLSTIGLDGLDVSVDTSVNIPAGQTVNVPLSVAVPAGTSEGTRVFSVQVQLTAGGADTVDGELIIAGGPGGSGGAGDPPPTVLLDGLAVDVALTPATVTGGQGTAAIFTVRVTNVGNEEDTYTLSGSFPSGFTGTFAEQQVTVLPGVGNFREVTLTVTPPPGAAVGNQAITVRATSTNDAGIQDDAAGSVNVVSQGVDVDITPSTGGPSTTFQMTVKNTGQSQDTFALQLGGPAGVSATLGTASVTLAPGASQTVPITLGSLNFALSGGLDLIGVATSQANTTVKDQDSAQILIGASKGLSVFITPTVVELPTPGAAAFLVQVDNTGNGEDAYKAEIMGTTGPVTAALNGLNRQPTQKIDLFRLPGLSTGGILLNATLTAPGEGKITVRVTSLTDASLTAQAVATVRTPGGGNHVPEVNAGADQKVIVRQLISLTATFTDADVNDTHTATVNWGDGTPVSGGTVTKNNGGGTVTASHSYLQPGKFTVTVCVKDNHDAQNCDTLVVTVVAAELAPFLCYQTKSSQGDVCAATAPKNAGKVCRTETDCGGHDGGEDDDDESRQSDDGDDDDGEETNFCAPRNFPHGLQLTLEDRFDTSLFEVRKPDDLCNPAVLNTKAPQDPTIHLRDFRLHLVEKQCLASAPRQAGEGCKKEEDCGGVLGRTRYCAAQPKFVPQKNLQVKNVFHPQGGLKLDLLKPEHLTLPAAKDHTKALPPPNPATHNVDPYTCYQAKLSQGTPQFPNNLRARVVDQFAQEKLYDLQKPTRLCTPTMVEGDEVKDADTHLMCYQVQPTPKVCRLQAPKNAGKVCGKETDCGGAQGQTTFCRAQPTHTQVKKVFVTTELLPEQVDTIKEGELCVPSEVMRTP